MHTLSTHSQWTPTIIHSRTHFSSPSLPWSLPHPLLAMIPSSWSLLSVSFWRFPHPIQFSLCSLSLLLDHFPGFLEPFCTSAPWSAYPLCDLGHQFLVHLKNCSPTEFLEASGLLWTCRPLQKRPHVIFICNSSAARFWQLAVSSTLVYYFPSDWNGFILQDLESLMTSIFSPQKLGSKGSESRSGLYSSRAE